jgi:hypothetical protein
VCDDGEMLKRYTYGCWYPDPERVIVAYHENTIEGCGGYAVDRQES